MGGPKFYDSGIHVNTVFTLTLLPRKNNRSNEEFGEYCQPR